MNIPTGLKLSEVERGLKSAASLESDLVSACRDAIIAEGNALLKFADSAQPDIVNALRLIHGSAAPLIVAGIGKSGHIGRKIASTFSSIGKPSVFVHAAEARHGDLGVIQDNSVVLVLSNSGETPELSDLIHYCRLHEIDLIALTADANSTLARNAKATIAYGAVQEVCPNGLAPTTSTTLSLAIGDALAVGLAHLLGTAPEDFRRFHPGGKLGAKLTSVADLMHVGDALPVVAPQTPMAEAVVVMSEKSLGILIVMDEGKVLGVVTDGDMRRHVSRLWHSSAGDIATPDPIFISHSMLATEAVKLMTLKGITSCLVAGDAGEMLGLLHIHDCLRLGVSQ